MRITSNMMSRSLLLNLNAAEENMTNMQNMMSTGHRINKPSDDPAGTHNALGLKTNMAMITQLKSNADESLSFMGTTDSTLSDVQSMLNRAYELTLQGENGTNDDQSRADIAAEIDQINQQIQTLANTKVGNKYIFNGTSTTDAPVVSSTASFATYSPIQLDVGNNNSKVTISVDGSSIFPASMSLLSDISNALTSGSDLSSYVNQIQTNIDNISSSRATLGASVNRVQAISSQMDTMNINLTSSLSTVQDTDVAKTILDFQTQQNTFQAALSIGTKIIQPSLVDFMK